MTATTTLVGHEWRITAPWWHWPARGTDPAPGDAEKRRLARVSSPVLQKYDGAHLVNTFLADPQRRLAFVDDTDRIATVGGSSHGMPTRTTAGGLRKVYLPTHHRHYLVVCSLHCDVAGFPRAVREDVCEAGFVVRRRTGDLPGGPRGETATELRRWAAARRKRAEVQQRLAAAGPLRRTALDRRLEALGRSEEEARLRVRSLAHRLLAGGSVRRLEGWVPLGVDAAGATVPMPACRDASGPEPLSGAGRWEAVEELPEQLAEAAFPLVPLIPDPGDPAHDAAGQTIYFGVLPTGSADVDPAGSARFDDASEYEIRCYARRHRPQCPRDGRHCGCPLTWSEPTEPYRLAGHFDLEGCANRPVTVQLPDLRQLRADTLRLGPGGAGGLRFSSPPNSELSFTTSDLTATKADDAMLKSFTQVCSFAIPLITIVAFFVLQLFLPIVIFVFQLWFMLMLRFCIPPDVEVDGGLLRDFEALGAGLDVDAGIAATVTSRPGFAALLAKLLQGSRPQGKRLDQELLAAGAQTPPTLDVRSLAAIGRGALAQTPAPPPAGPFARRVTRDEVVTP